MKKTSERPKYNMWQCAWYMISLAWKRHYKLVPLFCLAVAALEVGRSLLELLIAPVILSKVEHAAPLGKLLWTIGGFTGALMLVSGLRSYVLNLRYPYMINVRLNLVLDLDYKLNTTSYPHIQDAKFYEQLQRCNMALGNNAAPGEAIWQTLTNLLKSVAGFIIYLLLLSSLNPVMLTVILVTTVGGYFAGKHINEWGYRHRAEEESHINHTRYALNKMEDRKLSKDIRIFGMQNWLEDLYQSALRLYQAFLIRRERVYLWINVIDVALTFLRNGIAYFYLISMALRQDLSAAQFLLYFGAVSGFTSWITEILSQFSTLHKQCLELSVLLEVMHLPEPFRFEDGEAVSADAALPYELRLDHVSFRYPGAETDTLHDVCLTIPAGEKLAIVGLNGAGKTTLVKLLCGLYDPTEGRVLLNGKDIRTFNRRQYYGLFSAVFQDFSILPITLRENIAQTADSADTQRIWTCLAQAGLLEKVKSLPKGLDTPIGREVFEDGIELSGGETQRLMLARALYKNGPVLLLDEPTAALDPIAENDIYLKYNSMTEGRTSVFISHRLASTRFCDRILFLADGGIAEDGTHDTLMAQGGQYAALFQVQSKYYQKDTEQVLSEGSMCI